MLFHFLGIDNTFPFIASDLFEEVEINFAGPVFNLHLFFELEIFPLQN